MEIDKRFERILAIFIQLQAKPVVRAQDLAERFEVSLRTIYRDIRSLEKAGVPIYSEPGYGYSLASGYKLPPTLFTKAEALSFAVAEKLMQQYTDKEMSGQFSSALSKMKAVLRASDKENVQAVEEQLHLNVHQRLFNQEVPTALSVLFESIASKKQIAMQYKKPGNGTVEQRIVEPIGVFNEFGFWYFMAFCYLRQDVRQFRLDRIVSIEITMDNFTQKSSSLAYHLERRSNNRPKLEKVKVRVNKGMHHFMMWERQLYGFLEETINEEGVEMIFEYDPQYQSLLRWLISFADGIKVIEPESVRAEMLQLLHKMKVHLSAEGEMAIQNSDNSG